MPATQKAVAIARQLAESLRLRTGLTVTQGLDASANPTIQIGSGAAGSQSAFIRIKQDYDPALELDGIGLTQRRYTPHVIQVVLETSTIANVALMLEATKLQMWKEIEMFGTKIELYMSANTNAAEVSDIVAGNLKATVDDLWHPLTSTI